MFLYTDKAKLDSETHSDVVLGYLRPVVMVTMFAINGNGCHQKFNDVFVIKIKLGKVKKIFKNAKKRKSSYVLCISNEH